MAGHIRRRGRGSWEVQVELAADPASGRRRRRTLTVRGNRKDAERALTRAEYERDHGVDIAPDRITVAELLSRWLRDYAEARVAPSTLKRYRELAANLTRELGGLRVQDLRPAHVQSCYSALSARGLSARTVRHHHQLLHGAFRWAMRMQMTAVNPTEAIRPPTAPRREMTVLDEADLRRVLAASGNEELRRTIAFAAHTGVRLGELLALRWGDVDLDAGRASIVRSLRYEGGKFDFSPPKTSRSRRSVAIGRSAVALLREHRNEQLERRVRLGPAYAGHDLVFAREDGQPTSPYVLSKRFRQIVRSLGLRGVRWHDLRHTSATMALRAGVHPKIVSERLGHASVGITLDTYSHVLPDMQEAAAEALDAMIRLPEARSR